MTAGSGVSAALRVPEFRALRSAELLSVGGDQLARVALAVLVYGRTGSAVWAAATYAPTRLVGWYVVPEALAAPYADQLGSGSASAGLLPRSDPARFPYRTGGAYGSESASAAAKAPSAKPRAYSQET